jgi:heterodisulfide reductase subunit A
MCVQPCIYNAIRIDEVDRDGKKKKLAVVNEALCKGCGVCMATCPKGGIFVRRFSPEQLEAMVDAALEDTEVGE